MMWPTIGSAQMEAKIDGSKLDRSSWMEAVGWKQLDGSSWMEADGQTEVNSGEWRQGDCRS